MLHGPEELGYPALTEAMVDIRATLAGAVSSGILDAPVAARLGGISKALYYKERTYPAILARAVATGSSSATLGEFSAWLATGRVEQKRCDAELMLAAIRICLDSGPPPLRVAYELADTAAWQAARGRIEEEVRDGSPT